MEINEYRTESEIARLHSQVLVESKQVLKMPVETTEQKVAYIKAAVKSIHDVLTSPL